MGKKPKQKELAQIAGISESFLSEVLNGLKGPGWRIAKILARITGTKAEQWMDGTAPERKAMAFKYLGGRGG